MGTSSQEAAKIAQPLADQAEQNAKDYADTLVGASLQDAKDYTDQEVSAEASTRSTADSTLQTNINSEASTRATEDANTLSAANAYADANKQPIDADLTTIAALAPANDDLLQRKSGTWTNRTPAQVKIDLALTKADVSLPNADDTSDVNKPVSIAQAAADATVLSTANSYTDNQVVSLQQGLAYKDPARMAATGNVTLSGLQTIDTVVGSSGDRVFLPLQTNPAENGLWNMAAGAWSRTTDADTSGKVTTGMILEIREGSQAGYIFWLTTTGTIVLGTTPLTFLQINGAFSVLPGSGLTKVGNTLSIPTAGVTNAMLAGNIDLTTKVTGVLPVANGGTGTSTVFTTGSIVFAGAAGTHSQNNANLFWDNTTDRLGIRTNSPQTGLHLVQTTSGTSGTIFSQHTSNTTGSNAVFLAQVAGSSGGDAFINLSISGGQGWALGLDNSDSDSFLISASSDLGTSNVFKIDTAGAITTGTTLGMFTINATGNITKINNVATSWPSSQGAASTILQNDGAGNFSWVTLASTIGADYTATPTNPATTTNATGVMMGLAGSITPTKSGKIRVIVYGDADNSGGGNACDIQFRYGTGTAPTNGAALTGTTAGSKPQALEPNASGIGVSFSPGRFPFTVGSIVSGLTVGTAYWLDISVAAIGGGTARVRNITIMAFEA